MALSFQSGVIRFLSEPRGYTCDLPTTVDTSRPQLASVVTYAGRARSIGFRDSSDPAADPDMIAIGDIEKDGITVSLFRFSEPPPLLIAQWRLGGSRYLSTFMSEPHDDDPGAPGRDGLETVVQNVAVGWASGFPVISLGGALQPGDVRHQDQRDRTELLAPLEGPNGFPDVEFRREPSWTRESASVSVGEPMTLAAGGETWVDVSMVTSDQVRISCGGPAEQVAALREAVEHMAATLEPT